MTPQVALTELRAVGVRVRLGDDGTVALDASGPSAAAVLAFARAHREGIAALLWDEEGAPAPDTLHPVVIPADVPAAWCDGVAQMDGMTTPDGIIPARWATLAATSVRLLRDHGAALHRAGWDALDLFGLHQYAPATNPAGWGLAWLLGEIGEVLDVSPDAVGMRCSPNGARLAFRRRCEAARAGVVPAWGLAACARFDCGVLDLQERKEASRYG